MSGATHVAQSLAGKKARRARRTWLLGACPLPLFSFHAVSMYHFEERGFPLLGSTIASVKSRTTQRKEGKYSANWTPVSSAPLAATWMVFVSSQTRERSAIAVESIVPREL